MNYILTVRKIKVSGGLAKALLPKQLCLSWDKVVAFVRGDDHDQNTGRILQSPVRVQSVAKMQLFVFIV